MALVACGGCERTVLAKSDGSGAIVGGVAMAVRGRDLTARARTLDTD